MEHQGAIEYVFVKTVWLCGETKCPVKWKKEMPWDFFFKFFVSNGTIGGFKFFIHLCILSPYLFL